MIVLADTSVWIEHFKVGNPQLAQRLMQGEILIHAWIKGELAVGNLRDREIVLSYLNLLPSAQAASDSDAMKLIETRRLWGAGLGWVDVHLLASAILTNCRFWTLDKRLQRAAEDLGVT